MKKKVKNIFDKIDKAITTLPLNMKLKIKG